MCSYCGVDSNYTGHLGASFLQQSAEITGSGQAIGNQIQVPHRRMVLWGKVSETQRQDSRVRNHTGIHETEEKKQRRYVDGIQWRK